MKTFYVYEDWTIEESPRCFYVGKGDEDRVKRLKRGKYHVEVVSQFGQQRKIVLETSDESVAFETERRLILEHHTHPKDPNYNGVGCNRTTGGQGNSGRIVTQETCRKISQSKKGKTSSKAWTDEERRATSIRMSKLHKGKIISKEQKDKLRQRSNDPIAKAKMIEKVTQKIRDKYANDKEFVQRIFETRVRGEKSSSQFTNEDVIQMRNEFDRLVLRRGVVKRFCEKWSKFKGVTPEAIYAIVKRKTWRHLS